jgi:hypothetical protein
MDMHEEHSSIGHNKLYAGLCREIYPFADKNNILPGTGEAESMRDKRAPVDPGEAAAGC